MVHFNTIELKTHEEKKVLTASVDCYVQRRLRALRISLLWCWNNLPWFYPQTYSNLPLWRELVKEPPAPRTWHVGLSSLHVQSRDWRRRWCFPFSTPATSSCSVSVCRASGVDQGATAAAAGCRGRNVDPPLLRISFPPSAPPARKVSLLRIQPRRLWRAFRFCEEHAMKYQLETLPRSWRFQACACDLGWTCWSNVGILAGTACWGWEKGGHQGEAGKLNLRLQVVREPTGFCACF